MTGAPDLYVEAPNDEIQEVSTGQIQLLADYDKQQDWAELFQEDKTKWMGWERHLIENETSQALEQPETTEMGQIFAKLCEWKALPY